MNQNVAVEDRLSDRAIDSWGQYDAKSEIHDGGRSGLHRRAVVERRFICFGTATAFDGARPTNYDRSA
jgi:hypothetical protein